MSFRKIIALSIVTAAILTSGCAATDNWTRADTRRELAYLVVNTIDAAQTSQIQHGPYQEIDPLGRRVLGEKPSNGGTVLYFGTLSLSHYLISRALPERWRPWWQYGTIVKSTAVVINNCKIGLLCN